LIAKVKFESLLWKLEPINVIYSKFGVCSCAHGSEQKGNVTSYRAVQCKGLGGRYKLETHKGMKATVPVAALKY
jgi:hypothetical protein